MENPPYLDRLKEKFGSAIEESYRPDDLLTLVAKRDSIVDVLRFLKDDEESLFDHFMDLTAVDYLGKEPRFEVVIHLISIPKLHRIRVKIKLEQGDPVMPTITSVYPGANWFERECWDLYGIKFDGHPNLTRILLYEGFEGHPLRKDYPLKKRQPRVHKRERICRRRRSGGRGVSG
jgi:NADH-quinone oxidoreductase subunit C